MTILFKPFKIKKEFILSLSRSKLQFSRYPTNDLEQLKIYTDVRGVLLGRSEQKTLDIQTEILDRYPDIRHKYIERVSVVTTPPNYLAIIYSPENRKHPSKPPVGILVHFHENNLKYYLEVL